MRKNIFYRNFFVLIGTFNFIYCRNRKNQNHATSRLRKNLAVPYRKNKQNLQPTSADAAVEILTLITTHILRQLKQTYTQVKPKGMSHLFGTTELKRSLVKY